MRATGTSECSTAVLVRPGPDRPANRSDQVLLRGTMLRPGASRPTSSWCCVRPRFWFSSPLTSRPALRLFRLRWLHPSPRSALRRQTQWEAHLRPCRAHLRHQPVAQEKRLPRQPWLKQPVTLCACQCRRRGRRGRHKKCLNRVICYWVGQGMRAEGITNACACNHVFYRRNG